MRLYCMEKKEKINGTKWKNITNLNLRKCQIQNNPMKNQ